jgi:hypothetical protein
MLSTSPAQDKIGYRMDRHLEPIVRKVLILKCALSNRVDLAAPNHPDGDKTPNMVGYFRTAEGSLDLSNIGYQLPQVDETSDDLD